MADNDISSCIIRSDGWSCDVVVDGAGYAVGATYDFGSLALYPSTISTPLFEMNVVSPGYSATGVLGTTSRKVYGTKVTSQEAGAANSFDETDTGTGLTMRVSLSDYIYPDDIVTVNIGAGWCTSGANISNATATFPVTNNSTQAYPNAIAQWAWGHTPAWRGVTTDFAIGCVATAGFGIACVTFTATDAHAHTVSGVVTTKTKHMATASGLYYESYDMTVPIAGFTAGDDITLNFMAYPVVGKAANIIDTSTDTTSTDDCLGLTQITCRLVTSNDYLYVAAADHPTTPGDDTTGNGTTGTPYATIGKARAVVTEAAGKRVYIYVKAGGTTMEIIGSEAAYTAGTGCFIEVMPDPAGGAVTLNRGNTYFRTRVSKLLFSGFTITGNHYLSGPTPTGKVWFDNCTFAPASVGAVTLGYGFEFSIFNNCTWSNPDFLFSYSTSRVAYNFTGCYFSNASGYMGAAASIIACKMVGVANDDTRLLDKESSSAPLTRNLMYCNNAWLNLHNLGNTSLSLVSNSAVNGIAIIGNIIELAAGTQPALSVAGTVAALENLVFAHNTVVGDRTLLCYNDTGSVAIPRTNVFFRNNALESFNIKGRLFAPADANRIGNFALVNGVGISSNRYDGTHGFVCEYHGVNVAYVAGQDQVYGQLGYTNDQSQDGGSAGNGNYLPAVGSVLAASLIGIKYQTFDLFGTRLR